MVCPHCGAEVKQEPFSVRRPDEQSRPALPRSVMLLMFIIIMATGIFFFFNSDTYRTMKARKNIENGDYVAAVEILYDIMKRTGPSDELLWLASDALRRQGEERMEKEQYIEALPLFDEIVKNNKASEGTGGSKLSILLASFNKAICHLKIAQDRGRFVEPYGEDINAAEDMVKEGMSLIDEIDEDRLPGIRADLHLLAANIAAERAAAFWHEMNLPQAKAYFIEAEKEYKAAIRAGGDSTELLSFREELNKLRARIE
jgi:hypothetical protein